MMASQTAMLIVAKSRVDMMRHWLMDALKSELQRDMAARSFIYCSDHRLSQAGLISFILVLIQVGLPKEESSHLCSWSRSHFTCNAGCLNNAAAMHKLSCMEKVLDAGCA